MKTARIHGTIGALAAALLTATLLTAAPRASFAAASDLNLDVRPENRTILIPGRGDGTVQIQVIAPDDPAPRRRPNMNLSLVIDRSGSMS
ncbi:MAG: hypothetical protein IH611_07640, partial [Deltaproteobacteria bacterium]|nr:hypothetical protein [Deltaproteobacteria bacterium]